MPEAAWHSHDICAEKCPSGPSGCADTSCSSEHWLEVGQNSCHDAIHFIGGIGEVINIVNGGYDCCPSSTYLNQYGHTSHRVWWYMDAY